MNAVFDLVVVGDANPDLVLSGAPEELAFGQAEQLVESATLTLGGSGSLMAHAAARLGLRTAFVGLVGLDRAGDVALGYLTAAGVDVSAVVRRHDVATAITVVFTRPGGDRAILTAPGSLAVTSPDDVDRSLLARARHVHVTSPFLQPRLAAGLGELLRAARDAGATTSLDPNDDPSGQWRLEPDVLGLVDYLLPNAREAAALAFADPAATDVVGAVRALAERGPCVVAKCGPEGAIAAVPDRVIRARTPALSSELVDTIGAGDAFDAGLIAGLAQGDDLPGALRLGVAVGALSTRAAGGADGQPGLPEASELARTVVVEDLA